MQDDNAPCVVVGAGPAGLTAAYSLVAAHRPVVIFEADDVVGGISRTVERDGYRFDIGGHRFYTKVPAVNEFWSEILPDEDFLVRPRMSRIYYDNKLFDYPLRASNALRNLGFLESLRCIASYLWVRVRPPKNQDTLEGWVAARFGWRLYAKFFKTYNEKVWGVPADQIAADWAAQRIKNLSLFGAIVNALLPHRPTSATSLIEEFRYPRLGPGMMWERTCERVIEAGGKVVLNAPVVKVLRDDAGATAVVTDQVGVRETTELSTMISSMPLNELIAVMEPPAPATVRKAAARLSHRDFLTVALVVPEAVGFPDNWIYIHSPTVKVGRIQNYGAWSPDLVKDGRTCLGLEYFVFAGDALWERDDASLAQLAEEELIALGLIRQGQVEASYVVRMPKAYPIYDHEYRHAVEEVRTWLASSVPNVYPVGRNGMHKYNNQDHSMVTAMLSVENIVDGASHDVWSVNVDEDYHETDLGTRPSPTGRDAPMVTQSQ